MIAHCIVASLVSTATLGAAPPGGEAVAVVDTMTNDSGKEVEVPKPPSAPPDLASVKRACEDSLDIAIFNSPRWAHMNGPFRVLVVSETPIPDARIAALDPAGQVHELKAKPYGGPPWGWVATVDKPRPGLWYVGIGNGERVDACQKVRVRKHGWVKDETGAPIENVWRSRIKWERDTENLYSLWVEYLFEAPLDDDVSWKYLHAVTRDRKRNLLFDHLGLTEDSRTKDRVKLKPDCADFPYMLRAYFAWKMGLPFGFRGCTRGSARRAPKCGGMMSNHGESEETAKVAAFAYFVRKKVAGTVHSSTLRTAPRYQASDFYPVALTRKALRPGTIYTDPYGHTLMIGKWYPQRGDQAGTLLAIDAQPDGTIGRRVFWRGSFLFPEDDAVKGAGFKRFRPVRLTGGEWRQLRNEEIVDSIDYGDFSVSQWDGGKEGFYERMDELISPQPLFPEVALTATVDALEQQVSRRVESVENGEAWKKQRPAAKMRMPEGAAIFVTTGPWESYSTPSRDLRLLIAIDTVRNFPGRVVKYPHRFRLPEGKQPAQIKGELDALLAQLSAERKVRYTRSDGSTWTLTLADVMARTSRFEMAYNPNDCVETRWAAAPGSEEHRTCNRKAPAYQLRRMESYRGWFRERQRPLH